jgi:hypothetical protein
MPPAGLVTRLALALEMELGRMASHDEKDS